METGIGSLTDMLVNLVINEFNKQETRNKVNTTILAPIMNTIRKGMLPYFSLIITLIFIILILNIIIISLLIKKK